MNNNVLLSPTVTFFFLIIGIWLIGLSILLIRLFALFNRLTKGVDSGDLKKVLENVMAKEEVNSEAIKKLIKDTNLLNDDSKLHIQKVGFVRFNPFKELGGDHSFSLAILDGKDSGIIITSLHTRDRTRVYMKDVKMGKSSIDLSEEEKKALSKAQK